MNNKELTDQIVKYLKENGFDLIEKHNGYYNGRCPVCGDSKVNPNKKRFWIIFNDNQITAKCFNCGYSSSIYNFLKYYYPQVFDIVLKQKIDSFLKNNNNIKYHKETIKPVELIPFDLNIFQPFYKFETPLNYIKSRMIPEESYDKIYWYMGNDKNMFNSIVFPFFYYTKDLIYGLQYKRLDQNQGSKYITKFVKNFNGIRLYNAYSVNLNKTVYLTEGIFDSFFIDNSIAMLTSQLKKESQELLKDVDKVFIFDNDKTGIQKSLEYLKVGLKVFCMPDEFNNAKDLNELAIKYKLNKNDIKEIVDNNIVFGLLGILKIKKKLLN